MSHLLPSVLFSVVLGHVPNICMGLCFLLCCCWLLLLLAAAAGCFWLLLPPHPPAPTPKPTQPTATSPPLPPPEPDTTDYRAVGVGGWMGGWVGGWVGGCQLGGWVSGVSMGKKDRTLGTFWQVACAFTALDTHQGMGSVFASRDHLCPRLFPVFRNLRFGTRRPRFLGY